MTIEQARAFAANVCGYLVAINDAAEQSFLVANFTTEFEYWIGLSDENVEGAFEWDSGEAFSYAAWCAGEPNNFFLENYVTLQPFCGGAGPSGWNDVWPYGLIMGIIEIPAAPPGAGPAQANSDAATLTVNGDGCGMTGPFTVYVSNPYPPLLTLTWRGPSGAPYVLFAGPPAPVGFLIPCVGYVGVGTAGLGFSDVTFIYDGFTNPLYWTNDEGFAQQVISVPSMLPGGPLMQIQGAVGQPSGCPVKLTAAFYLEG